MIPDNVQIAALGKQHHTYTARVRSMLSTKEHYCATCKKTNRQRISANRVSLAIA